MKTLSDIRKAIKPLGFKVKTKTMSIGVHAKYTDMEGNEMPSMFFGKDDSWKKWLPLIEWKQENKLALKTLGRDIGVFGLKL